MNRLSHAWRRYLYRLSGRLPCRLITLHDKPYLERYHVGTLLGCRIYLHRFVRSDTERHVHNHPWRWAASLVLAGSYIEERAPHDEPSIGYVSTFRQVTLFNWITRSTRHRVTGVQPETWTLFTTGPRDGGWGFYENEPIYSGDGQLRYAVIFNPYTDSPDPDWHLAAPKGAQAGRAPMGGNA